MNFKSKRFVIIGAGNGGQSLAGDLILKGVNVQAIYNRGSEKIKSIQEKGGIQLSGPIVNGFAPISLVTSNLEKAIKAGNIFLVAITANAQKDFAKKVAPYVNKSQTFLLIPGYIGSSIAFARALKDAGVQEMPLIGEALSLPYATRLIAPAHAGIKSRKLIFPIAAFPASRNKELYNNIRPAISETILFSNTFEIGFNNPNPISHIVYYLFNLGKVESTEGKIGDFHSWGTPIVDRIKNDLDNERISITRCMGIKAYSYNQLGEMAYKDIHYTPIKQELDKLPPTSYQTPDRFIDEDIPMGLIPLQSFGKLLKIPTPTTDLIIQMANMVRQKDFAKEGTNITNLGLKKMSPEQMINYINF